MKQVPMNRGTLDEPETKEQGLFGAINELKKTPPLPKVLAKKNGPAGQRLTVADLYYKKDNSMLTKLASSRNFEYVTLAVISVNGMWIGIDTDHNTDWTTWPMEV